MTDERKSYDAIIIGAGIIGACTAFDFAKRGWRTLNLDKLPAAGYGSTGASCAIIRTHYSTLAGATLAYEGISPGTTGRAISAVADERGLAKFEVRLPGHEDRGNGHLRAVCRNMDALGIPWQDWGPERIRERLPFYDLGRFGPPKRLTTRTSARRTASRRRRVLPLAGYVNDPQLAAHNAQRAAEAKGAHSVSTARSAAIRRAGGRV